MTAAGGLGAHVLRVPAPAKINLQLQIVGLRGDGYHLLDSVVAPVRLFDEVRIAIGGAPGRISLECTGGDPSVPGDARNLAVRAAQLYMERSGFRVGLHLRVIKRIPAGAGLGGGSSNAAAVLRGLNALAPEPVSAVVLSRWGLDLGADIPLFLYGRPARMTGIGEYLAPVALPQWVRQPLVVAHPGVPLATKAVYDRYDGSLTSVRGASSIRALTPGPAPLQDWLSNDLEAAAFQVLPSLKELKRTFRALGARAVAMTGSGSAIFGFWSQRDDAGAAVRWLRAAGFWAHGTEVLEQIPVMDRDERHGGRSPSW